MQIVPLNNRKIWDRYEQMPDGWQIDRYTGSPEHGWIVIHNGKNMIQGGKRALLRWQPTQREIILKHEAVTDSADSGLPEGGQEPDPKGRIK